MPRRKYRIEPRQERVYNALTGRLNRAYVVICTQPRTVLPGAWTRKAAAHIARTINNPH